MTVVTVDERAAAICVLTDAADAFATRAEDHESLRDKARAGTAVQQLHAHSATLWRQAEGSLRIRISDLEHE